MGGGLKKFVFFWGMGVKTCWGEGQYSLKHTKLHAQFSISNSKKTLPHYKQPHLQVAKHVILPIQIDDEELHHNHQQLSKRERDQPRKLMNKYAWDQISRQAQSLYSCCVNFYK